jgi:hypothetical protein
MLNCPTAQPATKLHLNTFTESSQVEWQSHSTMHRECAELCFHAWQWLGNDLAMTWQHAQNPSVSFIIKRNTGPFGSGAPQGWKRWLQSLTQDAVILYLQAFGFCISAICSSRSPIQRLVFEMCFQGWDMARMFLSSWLCKHGNNRLHTYMIYVYCKASHTGDEIRVMYSSVGVGVVHVLCACAQVQSTVWCSFHTAACNHLTTHRFVAFVCLFLFLFLFCLTCRLNS